MLTHAVLDGMLGWLTLFKVLQSRVAASVIPYQLKKITPCGIQRRWKIPTFEEILNTYPRDSLPYPDAPLQLTDIQNGIYLHNMVCHNFCHCLFSQIYNVFRVQTITSDDYKISTQTEYNFQWHILQINYLTNYITRYFEVRKCSIPISPIKSKLILYMNLFEGRIHTFQFVSKQY